MTEFTPNDLDTRSRELLSIEKALPRLRDDVRTRIRQRVEAGIGKGRRGETADRVASAPRRIDLRSSLIGVAVGAIGAAAVLMPFVLDRRPQRTDAVREERRVQPGAPLHGPSQRETNVREPEPSAPSIERARVVESSAPARRATRVTSPPHGQTEEPSIDLDSERRYVDSARSALTSGNASGALEIVARHRAAAPNGILSEERDALEIRALIDLGRREDAMSRLLRFVAAYPSSPHTAALRAHLASAGS